MSLKRAVRIRLRLEERRLAARTKKKKRTVLFKQGAYLRKTMQRSMRYASKKNPQSKPGEPPRAHKDTKRGPLLRKLITFEVDVEKGSVVCGPKLTTPIGSTTVPELLDKGGKVRLNRKRQLKAATFEPGEYGPVRDLGKGRFVRIMLETPAQCERASRLIMEENLRRAGGAVVEIKPRPFTKPVFSDGGKNFEKLLKDVPL